MSLLFQRVLPLLALWRPTPLNLLIPCRGFANQPPKPSQNFRPLRRPTVPISPAISQLARKRRSSARRRERLSAIRAAEAQARAAQPEVAPSISPEIEFEPNIDPDGKLKTLTDVMLDKDERWKTLPAGLAVRPKIRKVPPRPPKPKAPQRVMEPIHVRTWDVHGNYLGFRWLNPRYAYYPYLRTTHPRVLELLHRRAVLFRRHKLREQAQLERRRLRDEFRSNRPSRFDQSLVQRAESMGLKPSPKNAAMLLVLFLESMHSGGSRRAPASVLDKCHILLRANKSLRSLIVSCFESKRFDELRRYAQDSKSQLAKARWAPDDWRKVTRSAKKPAHPLML